MTDTDQRMEEDNERTRSTSPGAPLELPLITLQVGNMLMLAGLCREDINDIIRLLLHTLERTEAEGLDFLFTEGRQIMGPAQDVPLK